MLAQPRKKSKIALNPRGTLWSNDENTFGKKLLEKMGWAKGKGLGKEEQGIKNPIHVPGNSESKGFGFSDKTDLSSQHYENFEEVLSSLNTANNSESSNSELENDSNHLKNIESLEMKSKNSKARVHYAKFTRGKDLSRYNENDLASVLGTKKILERKSKNESIMDDLKAEEMSTKNENFSTCNVNLKDYFNQKMEELKLKRSEGLLRDEETPKRTKKESASQPGTPFPNFEFDIEKSNFSFNYSVQEDDVKLESSTGTVSFPEAEEKNEEEAGEKIVEKKKKRKKSKKNDDIEKIVYVGECPKEENHNEITDENFMDETEKEEEKALRKFRGDYDNEIHSPETKSKKKKKKKKKHSEEEYDSSCKSIKLEEENDNEIREENNTDKTGREEKKMRKKLKNEDAEEIHSSEKKTKKKKKKKHNKEEEYDSSCKSIEPEEENHNEVSEENNEGETERDEKKMRKKIKNEDTEEIHSSEKESKKKKKKHIKEEEYDSGCKSIEPQRHGDSELYVKDEVQSYSCNNMNESYVKATSTSEKNKNKKRKEYEETSDEKENVSASKPLKKLRKLASEISLPEILKSSSEKIENENNVNCELENQADVYKKTEEEKANPKVKLKSKRSFKELKTNLETKVKETIKKISKSELLPIDEETVLEENKRKKSEAKKSKIVNVMVPVGYDNGDYITSAPKKYKTVPFDIQKTFPNSNLDEIKGYFNS